MKREIYILSEEAGEFYPASVTDAVGHDQMKTSLTKLINSYNLSTCRPTDGIGGEHWYNLELALKVLNNLLDDSQKIPGVRLEFTNTNNQFEEWEFIGETFNFNDSLGWRRIDSNITLELLEAVFPLSSTMTMNPSNGLVKVNEPTDIKLSWSIFRKGSDVTSKSRVTLNNELVNSSNITKSINLTGHSTISFNISASYQNLTTSSIKYVTAVHDCFYGVLDESNTSIDENFILGLNKTSIKNSKSFSWTNIEITNKRLCYAYPKYHGELSSIKDSNNFEYLLSYDKSEVLIHNTLYLVYTLKKPTTVSKYKQIYL